MKKNECLFSFGKINKYFIIPFLCPIFCFLSNYFIKLYIFIFIDEKKIVDDKLYRDFFKRKSYLIITTAFLSYFVGGLLYFISYIKTKKYHRESKEINSLKIFSILFVMSLLMCFNIICGLYFINKKTFEKRLYYLIFIPIFSKYVLKVELFRHQIFSIFIFIIGLLFLLISFILNEKSEIIFNILKVITSANTSFNYVMVKQLTDKYFLSPYLCLLYLGFFSLIISLIGFIAFYLIIDCNLENFIGIFKGESLTSVVYLIFYFFLGSFTNVLSFLIIFYFSPTLLLITDIINPIINWIITLFKKDNKAFDIVMNSIGYFLVLFSALIYNEIIICNCFGLNRNTKKNLEIIQREELSSMIDNDDDDGIRELKKELN